jgi:hypothetical protein
MLISFVYQSIRYILLDRQRKTDTLYNKCRSIVIFIETPSMTKRNIFYSIIGGFCGIVCAGLIVVCARFYSHRTVDKSGTTSNASASNSIDGHAGTTARRFDTNAAPRSAFDSSGKISYSVFKRENSPFSTLTARKGDRTVIVVDTNDNLCLSLIDERDFDGNGTIDALVEDITACGGNGSANSYFFVTEGSDGAFVKTKEVGYTYDTVTIEPRNGVWSILIASTNVGMNTEPPQTVTERFILRDGAIVRVSADTLKSIPAIEELRSDLFDFNNPDEQHRLTFDIDGDAVDDTIVATLWAKWGQLFWNIRFGNGKSFDQNDLSGKRVGILESTSGGYHDLVIDENRILHWNGTKYQQSN